MSVVRVFFNPLNARDKQEFPIAPGTQLIDFLQKEFPTGFDGVLRVFVGVDEIDLDDLDYEVQPEELITMLVMPTGGISVGAIVLQALVAVAVGFIINLIFPPKVPGGGKDESESPVYSLNASRNASRLGDPVECSYGKVVWAPSFASAPYIFNYTETNDQFADHLLCLGAGDYDIEDVYIGDTPASSMEPGTVQWWKFGPDDHQERLGIITNTINGRIANTAIPFPFRENVFTSPEVEDIQAPFNLDDRDLTSAGGGLAGVALAAGFDPVAQENVAGRITEVDSSLDIRAGDTITIAGTASNNGDFIIEAVTVDPLNPAIMTLYQKPDQANQFVYEDPLAGSYTINQATNILSAGPFRAQKPGQQCTSIQVDFSFPEGLYRIDGTNQNIKSGGPVKFDISCQRIDSNGDPIDPPIVRKVEYEDKTRVAVRITEAIGVPLGAYEVTVIRTSAVDPDTKKHERVSWTGLKGVLAMNGQVPAYGPVTLLAVRLKASEGLGGAARSRIRVTATRNLGDGKSSDNPITVMKDIWTDPTFGMGRPLDELETSLLDLVELEWEAMEGGPSFNGSFDKRSTGFEAMNSVMSLAGAKVIQVGGLTSISQEQAQAVRTALFSSANMVRDSLKIEYAFDTDNDYDGVQIEYNDPVTFQPAFVTQPGDATFPDTYTLFGCTDFTYASAYARYMRNVKRLRRKKVTFSTELDGIIPRIGDRIAVSSPMPNWATSGVVTDIIDATTLRVDRMLPWSETEDNYMMLRSDVGRPSSTYLVTKGTDDNEVVFGEVPDVTINDAQGMEPTSYVFGTQDNMVRDFVLSKITPQSNNIIQIEGQTYTAAIYDGAPPQMDVP